jgi:hypothetical protein
MKARTNLVGIAAVGLASALFTIQANAALVFGSKMIIDVSAIGAAGSANDADTLTDSFTQFTVGQLLATSVYDVSDGTPLGSFFDTNDPAILAALGADEPLFGQRDVDGLNPLSNATDDLEGFNNNWFLTIDTDIGGVLTPTGPTYNTGSITVNSFVGGVETQALKFEVTGSSIDSTSLGLVLNFNLTEAISNFLFVETLPNSGNFVDASVLIADAIANGTQLPMARFDTNVDSLVPLLDDLELAADGSPQAWRQTTLDGSFGVLVPAPATLALFGIGLIGAGLQRMRRAKR